MYKLLFKPQSEWQYKDTLKISSDSLREALSHIEGAEVVARVAKDWINRMFYSFGDADMILRTDFDEFVANRIKGPEGDYQIYLERQGLKIVLHTKREIGWKFWKGLQKTARIDVYKKVPSYTTKIQKTLRETKNSKRK